MQCLIIDDLVLVSEKGTVHPDLQEFYQAYRADKIAQGEEPLKPRDWIPLARGRARAWLVQRLGANINRIRRAVTSPVLIHIMHIPTPAGFLDDAGELNQRFRQLVRYLERDDISRKLWDRLAVFQDAESEARRLLADYGKVSMGHLNIFKGNIAEVFSVPHQLVALTRLIDVYPEATLITGVRVRLPDSRGRRLFSDNIIGSFTPDGNLAVHHVFEVKAGYNGGVAGAEQVIRWDQRFEEGVELLVPADADVFVVPRSGETSGIFRISTEQRVGFLQPNSSQRVGHDFVYGHNMPGSHRALNLRGAQRDVVATLGQSVIRPDGNSFLGLDQLGPFSPDVEQISLGLSHEEVDFLVHFVLTGQSL